MIQITVVSKAVVGATAANWRFVRKPPVYSLHGDGQLSQPRTDGRRRFSWTDVIPFRLPNHTRNTQPHT
jgi:hypothetical protein